MLLPARGRFKPIRRRAPSTVPQTEVAEQCYHPKTIYSVQFSRSFEQFKVVRTGKMLCRTLSAPLPNGPRTDDDGRVRRGSRPPVSNVTRGKAGGPDPLNLLELVARANYKNAHAQVTVGGRQPEEGDTLRRLAVEFVP